MLKTHSSSLVALPFDAAAAGVGAGRTVGNSIGARSAVASLLLRVCFRSLRSDETKLTEQQIMNITITKRLDTCVLSYLLSACLLLVGFFAVPL